MTQTASAHAHIRVDFANQRPQAFVLIVGRTVECDSCQRHHTDHFNELPKIDLSNVLALHGSKHRGLIVLLLPFTYLGIRSSRHWSTGALKPEQGEL